MSVDPSDISIDTGVVAVVEKENNSIPVSSSSEKNRHDSRSMSAVGEDTTGWNHQWELAANSIFHSNTKLAVLVTSPEIISSMMSK